jgi:hypothetical protein
MSVATHKVAKMRNLPPLRWHWFTRQYSTDKADARLTFNDVVFGIVITEIFLEALPIERLRWSVRIHLLLAFLVTVASYIGYRKSKKRTEKALAFFNLPLIQFALDLGMIYLYYRLSITPDLVAHPAAGVVPDVDAKTVLYIFILYLAWDAVSWSMWRRGYIDVTFYPRRAAVTLVCLALAGTIAVVAGGGSATEESSLAIDSALIVLALLYRWVKDGLYTDEPPASSASAAGQAQ